MPDPVVLEVGQVAPPIAATATGEGPFSLEDHRNEWVAVYFYPRANTPG